MFGLIRTLACVVLAAVALPGSLPAAADEPAAVPVYLYHRFSPTLTGPTTVTTGTFESNLAWLAQEHYRVVRLGELVAALRAGKPLEPMTAAITVDDGHPSVYSEMFPLIQRYRVPVTLFICPAYISTTPSALSWEQLAEMIRSGLVDVQAHTIDHPDLVQERARRSPANFAAFAARQLQGAKAIIEQRLGVTVELLAWPYGSYDSGLEQLAAQSGYTAAFGVARRPAEAGDDLYGIPRIAVFDPQRYPWLAGENTR